MDENTTMLKFEALVQGIDDMDVENDFQKIWGLDWHDLANHKPGERLLGVGWGGVGAYQAHNRLIRTCESDFCKLWEETVQKETLNETVKEYTELVCYVTDQVAGYIIGELLGLCCKIWIMYGDSS